MNKVPFTSPGLNYFQAIVPKVAEFKRRFIDTGQIKTVEKVQSAVSITDPEAKFMKNKKERDVTQECTDHNQLQPLIELTGENLGGLPEGTKVQVISSLI